MVATLAPKTVEIFHSQPPLVAESGEAEKYEGILAIKH